jgi:hypothetical protein
MAHSRDAVTIPCISSGTCSARRQHAAFACHICRPYSQACTTVHKTTAPSDERTQHSRPEEHATVHVSTAQYTRPQHSPRVSSTSPIRRGSVARVAPSVRSAECIPRVDPRLCLRRTLVPGTPAGPGAALKTQCNTRLGAPLFLRVPALGAARQLPPRAQGLPYLAAQHAHATPLHADPSPSTCERAGSASTQNATGACRCCLLQAWSLLRNVCRRSHQSGHRQQHSSQTPLVLEASAATADRDQPQCPPLQCIQRTEPCIQPVPTIAAANTFSTTALFVLFADVLGNSTPLHCSVVAADPG